MLFRRLGIFVELVIHGNIIAVLIALAKMITGFSTVSPLFFMCSSMLMLANGFAWSKMGLFLGFARAFYILSFVDCLMVIVISAPY